MKRVLVVDWLDKFGGAERVIANLQRIFGFQHTYTLVNIMKKNDLTKVYAQSLHSIHTTYLQVFGAFFRFFFFLFHRTIAHIRIDDTAQTIISSSHAVAKGVSKASSQQLHISYFQARNFKYIWEDAPLYFGKWLPLIKPLIHKLQKIDREHAQKPDFIIANSYFVKDWIWEKYQRTSHVIYPPVDLDQFPLQEKKSEYYVAVGRIVAYKRFDLIVEAFSKLDKKLIILGDGPELNSLKKKATSNIQFTGFVDADTVYKYISQAKAFIHIGIEDFGIAPIEAQSCGTPVIAYQAGGILETVCENKTGLFFEKQQADSLITAIERFESQKWNPREIHLHAQKFSTQRFEEELLNFVNTCEQEFFQN